MPNHLCVCHDAAALSNILYHSAGNYAMQTINNRSLHESFILNLQLNPNTVVRIVFHPEASGFFTFDLFANTHAFLKSVCPLSDLAHSLCLWLQRATDT